MKRLALDVDDLVRRYLAGESCLELSKAYDVSRIPIIARLREAGIEIRGRSLAERLKWSRMSRARRAAQVQKAHLATRGRPKSLMSKMRNAQTKQARRIGESPLERRVAKALRTRGLETIPQYAIGPYNCDLAAYPVAVEIFGGGWHWHGRHMRRAPERIRYILNAGWHLLMVRIDGNSPFTDATADYIVSYVQAARREPSARRQYRVIRRTGELIASGSRDDDQISIVPTFTSGRNPANGRYQTIAR